MIQCKDCEFCQIGPAGQRTFKCDPFVNIKEPECIMKLQLIRLDMLLAGYQSMLKMQQKLAPLQDKIIRYVQHEIDDIDEAERWKIDYDEDKPNPDDDSDHPEDDQNDQIP